METRAGGAQVKTETTLSQRARIALDKARMDRKNLGQKIAAGGRYKAEENRWQISLLELFMILDLEAGDTSAPDTK